MSKYVSPLELIRRGNQRAEAGITIEAKPKAWPSEQLGSEQKRRGRPAANVLDAAERRQGTFLGAPTSITMRAGWLRTEHRVWLAKFDRNKFLKSAQHKRGERRLWTVYYAAELAWILMGNHRPENPYKRPKFRKNTMTFVDESVKLWRFCTFASERHKVYAPGRNLNPEKHFKTAMSTYVARKLVYPKGGNSMALPSPMETAQVWYLLFGEYERPDVIKNRLPTTGSIIKRYRLDSGVADSYYYKKLIKPIAGK